MKAGKKFFWVLVIFILSYWLAMQIAWSLNNPKANRMTILTHFVDALQFKSLPEFQ